MGLGDNSLLFAAGLGSLMIALLHIVIIYLGPPAYRYFGAGEKMARMAENGSLYPTLLTSGITLVFIVFAIYAFSGAEIIKPLPFLRLVLIGIGTIFTLRGLAVTYFVYLVMTSGHLDLVKDMAFSLVSLTIGLFYLGGVF